MPFIDGLYYTDLPATGTSIRQTEVPVLLIHGAFGSHLDWPGSMRRIPGHRTLAIDLPGHGKSERPAPETLSEFAVTLSKWLRLLQIPKVTLLGHSMGGAIALELAAFAPALVSQLVLLNSALQLPTPFASPDQLASDDLAPLMDTFARMIWAPIVAGEVIEKTIERLRKASPSTIRADLHVCRSADLKQRAQHLNLPVLVIGGAQDAIIPPDRTQQLADAVKHSKLVLFEGSGHMVMFEKTAEVLTAIGVFLDS